MNGYGAFSDDFYMNMILTTEMELPKGRESILHFFEQIRRRYPNLQNFYGREKNEFVLEEEKEAGAYRWVSTESKRVNSGAVNPPSADAADELNRTVLELVPYELSVSPLDCESLSVMFGFDFAYRGNHNEMLADVVGVAPGLKQFSNLPYGKVLSHEPAIQFSLDEDCRTQCRVSFESRTNAYQVRTGDFGEEQISVYLTVRRYDSLGPDENYAAEYDRLVSLGRDLVDEYLVTSVLKPLQDAISLR
ncbi:hypothetical protein [Novipirellula artificiosorum]|uniref:TIGR04255 family protein n=1 Tax=Novipirellula artificiosorum TaxID=2528016 RepID=A0A5C6DZH8_9BACT|nr:hypothetical protein [Novipirellula artificiosorum]TWU42022.1 hypothetical protein Poly41_03180 [Novipirellula artificiosorum]